VPCTVYACEAVSIESRGGEHKPRAHAHNLDI